MSPYLVQIGVRGNPRLSFGAMAPDSSTCVNQHIDLCEEGERIEVLSLDEEARAIAADLARAKAKADGSLDSQREAEAGRRERQYRDAQEWANGRRS